MNKLLCVALAILMLSGCASNRFPIQPIMDSGQSHVSNTGYVAVMFSHEWEPGKLGFGLGLVNTATAEKYVVPFGKESVMPGTAVDEFSMIQLPPGEYRIEYWLTYSRRTMEQLTQTNILPGSMAGLTFTLAPGEVVFAGSYIARNQRASNSDYNNPWFVRQQQLSLPSVQKALTKNYPDFASQPLSCPSCLK